MANASSGPGPLRTALLLFAVLQAASATAAQSPASAAGDAAADASTEDGTAAGTPAIQPPADFPAPVGEADTRSTGTASHHVVKLRDGSEYRGLMSELVPGSHLVMVLVTGETRRFELEEVARVEAEAGASPTAAEGRDEASDDEKRERSRAERGKASAGEADGPLITVHGERARLRFMAEHPQLTFHLGTGVDRRNGTVVGMTGYPCNDWFVGSVHSVGDRFDRICTAPCEASIPAGSYRMALSTPESGLLVLDDPVQVPGSGRVEGTYRSNSGIRTAGWITGGGSLLAGLTLTLIGYADRSEVGSCAGGPCEERANAALVVSGIAVAFAGLLAGAIMVSIDDEASIRFTPENERKP